MTSATVASIGRVEQRRPAITPLGWCWIGAMGVLFIFAHATYLERLFRIVTHAGGDNVFELLLSGATSTWNPDWSHALIVPLISAFYIYQHRRRLAHAHLRVWLPALPLMFAGLVSYVFWVYPGRNDMLQGYSMLITLFALVLFVLGPAAMRVLWFPIAFLAFGVKIADSLWERVAWQLQQIASQAAVYALKFFSAFINFDVVRHGTTLDLVFAKGGAPVHASLNVAEACSGLRSLMAFVALGTALAFLWERPWWQRLVMVAMAVPIAVGVNVARLTTIGLLTLVDPKFAEGDFHTMIGMLMLLPATGLFFLLGWIMDRIIVRDEDDPRQRAAGALPEAAGGDEANPNAPVGLNRRDVPRLVLAAGLAFIAGAAAMVAAAGVYWLAFRIGAPAGDVRAGGYLLLILSMLIQMAWFIVPAALVGGGLCVAAWLAVRPMMAGLHWRPGPRLAASALAVGVLLTMAVTQSVVEARLGVVLIKQPVPMRYPLVLLPAEVGSWKMVREEKPLPRAQVEELGTEKYITRVYADQTWPAGEPGGAVRMHVAYYTGTTDTVPHVPDRCFVAGGMRGIDVGITTLTLTGDQYRADPEHGGFLAPVQPKRIGQPQPPARVPSKRFSATYFTFGAPTTGVGESSEGALGNAVYFFAANGKFLPTPNHVRAEGFDTHDRYSYYCKVEVQVFGVADPQVAADRTSAFLSAMLPEIMSCLPDWVDVTEGRWPAEEAPTESRQ